MVFIAAKKGPAPAGFSTLGVRGKPAEQVAEERSILFYLFWIRARRWMSIWDQLLPYLALATGRSGILVQGVSSHLRTNFWVVNQFLSERLTLEGEQGLRRVVNATR